MKILYAALPFALLTVHLAAGSLEDCKCPDYAVPKKDRDGRPFCLYKDSMNHRPCNLEGQKVKCRCGPGAIGISNDGDGKGDYCIMDYDKETEETTKADCVNKKELDEYNEKYPDDYRWPLQDD